MDRAIALAQRLVIAGYPELANTEAHVIVFVERPFENEWAGAGPLSVLVGRKHHDPGDHRRETLLVARLSFDERVGGISTATFDGAYTREDDLRALTEALEAKSEATADDVTAMLTARGAKFPPAARSAFMRSLNLRRFESVTGPIADSQIRFASGALPSAPSEDGIAQPLWYVSVRGLQPRHGEICYSLMFEPFDGRLVSYGAFQCVQ